MNDVQPKEYFHNNCKSSCCSDLSVPHMHDEDDNMKAIPLCKWCREKETCAEYYEYLKGRE